MGISTALRGEELRSQSPDLTHGEGSPCLIVGYRGHEDQVWEFQEANHACWRTSSPSSCSERRVSLQSADHHSLFSALEASVSENPPCQTQCKCGIQSPSSGRHHWESVLAALQGALQGAKAFCSSGSCWSRLAFFF